MSIQTPRRGGVRRFFLAAAALLALAACSDDAPLPVQAPGGAPRMSRASADSTVKRKTIPDQYIVVLDSTVRDVPGFVRGLAKSPKDSVLFVYQYALKGFAARLSAGAVEGLRHNPKIASIIPDEYGTMDQSSQPIWSLDRADQRSLPLNGTFAPNQTGAGVNVYVVDTGIRKTHQEFDGGARVRAGYTSVADGYGTGDCNGHGTHVAATVAGRTYGVAEQATIYPVRISGCNGTVSASAAIAGLDWVRVNHVKPAVVNLSFSWPVRSDIDNAVTSLINAGVVVVTSAGNNNADACSYSPKRVSSIISVGNTDSYDTRAPDSNWGSCVQMFAPGVGIVSAWNGSDTDSRTLTGTSMSSPLVAGIAALYLQNDPTAPVWKVREAVINSSTFGSVADAQGTPNRLAYALPVYLGATVSGPNGIPSAGTYTWEAVTDGGNGSYTYQWTLDNHLWGYTQTLGTGRTQSVYLNPGDGDFTIQVTVTSADQTISSTLYVFNGDTGCGADCTVGTPKVGTSTGAF